LNDDAYTRAEMFEIITWPGSDRLADGVAEWSLAARQAAWMLEGCPTAYPSTWPESPSDTSGRSAATTGQGKKISTHLSPRRDILIMQPLHIGSSRILSSMHHRIEIPVAASCDLW
jgi:hypothetical protein